MNIPAFWRRAAMAVLTISFAALLSGCVLSSKTVLVPADEAVELLPASFTFVTYKEDKAGGYIKTEDPPGTFALAAGTKTYADDKGEMTVYFTPRPDGTHLINIVSKAGEEGAMYGIARYKDGILELRMIFSANPETELQAAGIPMPGGTTVSEGAVTVVDRAGLDAILELMAKGIITTSPLIAWAGDGTPPATIVKDGDWYKGA
jgi:hypothetical protein